MRELLQQALDALQTCDVDYDHDEYPHETYDSNAVNTAIVSIQNELAKPDAMVGFTDGEDGLWIHMQCDGYHIGLNLSEMDICKNFIAAYRKANETT